ncbi:hypothetical protein GGD83_000569 [Rhodoblastus sphagnicola]|nr:hypothetical protein [Rhodoblastus sphagnicola]
MIRPIVKLACAALLGSSVLLAPGPESAQAAPISASILAMQAGSSPLIEKTYYYRRHYRRHYGHHRHWRRW